MEGSSTIAPDIGTEYDITALTKCRHEWMPYEYKTEYIGDGTESNSCVVLGMRLTKVKCILCGAVKEME